MTLTLSHHEGADGRDRDRALARGCDRELLEVAILFEQHDLSLLVADGRTLPTQNLPGPQPHSLAILP